MNSESHESSITASHHAYTAKPVLMRMSGPARSVGVLFLNSRNRDSSRGIALSGQIFEESSYKGYMGESTEEVELKRPTRIVPLIKIKYQIKSSRLDNRG